MENQWTAKKEIELAVNHLIKARELLEQKKFGPARSELNLAEFHLKKAEGIAVKNQEFLPGIYRNHLLELKLKLRLRDHLMNWLGL